MFFKALVLLLIIEAYSVSLLVYYYIRFLMSYYVKVTLCATDDKCYFVTCVHKILLNIVSSQL